MRDRVRRSGWAASPKLEAQNERLLLRRLGAPPRRKPNSDVSGTPSRAEWAARARHGPCCRTGMTIGLTFWQKAVRGLPSIAALAWAWAWVGCATIENDHWARPVDAEGKPTGYGRTPSGLRVTGEEVGLHASRYFGLVELTFENPTTEWRNISDVHLDFGGEELDAYVRYPQGQQLTAWYRANQRRNEIRQQNQGLALAALGASGRALSRTSDTRVGRVLGGAMAITALAGFAARRWGEEPTPLYPDSHLLSGPFSVPPGLFVKRWVLINTVRSQGVPCLHSVTLGYAVNERGDERVRLRFKERTAWQKLPCKKWFGVWFER